MRARSFSFRAARSLGFGLLALGSALFACTSNTGDSGAGSSGSFSDDAGGGGEQDGGGGEEEGGGNPGPNCSLQSTGYKLGTVAVSKTRGGTSAAWDSPRNAFDEDGTFAKATLGAGSDATAELIVSGFGFAIPENAQTWGIEVEFTRRAPEGGLVDDRIEAVVEGKVGRYKYIPTPWPSKIVGKHHYGQAVDTWGHDLYPADVNRSTFAIRITAKRDAADGGAGGPVSALVDGVKVAVHYCVD